MAKIHCTKCERSFKGEAGLRWHLEHAHGEAGGENQGERASMAQEAPQKREITFAELSNAAPEVTWTSPVGAEVVRGLIGLSVLDQKDVPKEVMAQPETPKEAHIVYLVA